jgi:hypothetical protein
MGIEQGTPFTSMAVDVDHYLTQSEGEGYARKVRIGYYSSCAISERVL